MRSDHAKMLQIPCKMTDSSSKLLQIQGKWYQERKPNKNPKPEPKKDPKTILNPYLDPQRPAIRQFQGMVFVGSMSHWSATLQLLQCMLRALQGRR